MKIVNRKASSFKFFEKYEAGIVLTGAEIKSIREGRVNISEAFVRLRGGEVWLINAHVNPWMGAKIDPRRSRKLLLKKDEIRSLSGKVAQKGLVLVPLSCYIKHNMAKLEIALAKSKKEYEKRRDLKKRDEVREMERELRGK